MWLKIIYDEDDLAHWKFQPQNISVSLDFSIVVPIPTSGLAFRCSPIFPLCTKTQLTDISNINIMYFSLPNAYAALGRLERMGDQSLQDLVFFSVGLASVILFYRDDRILNQFHNIVKQVPYATEHWIIIDGKITNINPLIENRSIDHIYDGITLDYSKLDVTERAIVDEFRVGIKLLLLKLTFHMPSEIEKIRFLVDEVQKHTESLVYLKTHSGDIPQSLNEYSAMDLMDKKLESTIRHQKIDRIVQINSSLSYISTQAFSGAIPILERRSLVRRNSLLGIGSAILALNRIARFIENAFATVAFEDIITDPMKIAPGLRGLEKFPQYTRSDWHKSSVEVLKKKPSTKSYSKLPYFSGRLGYRETEYSIAAAIQSVTSGASLEWSLMTITHEMLHGHVRTILTTIFFNEEQQKAEDLQRINYDQFAKWADNRTTPTTLDQSIRNVIIGYCCLTATHGSMSKRPPEDSEHDFRLLDEEQVWKILGEEQRNINEIFVHVLDLHYFYAGKTGVYIPLIWCTWLSVPHVIGQLRHYILRSVLSISSTIVLPTVERFWASVERFKEILVRHKSGKLNYPTIKEIISILEDRKKLLKEYFYAFSASLCLVDLVKDVFYSSTVREALLDDFRVQWVSDEKSETELEKQFDYILDPGFNDECIEAPLAYLLDRMITELESTEVQNDLERETTIQFLALNSVK